MGYYPSEDEVQNIINEVRYKNFVNTGETQEFVGLVCPLCTFSCTIGLLSSVLFCSHQSEVIRLYLNHRPALPLDKALIGSAFDTICDSLADGQGGNQVSWAQLRQALMEEGEGVSAEDLDAYLAALTGAGADAIPSQQMLDPKLFVEHILGFEDFAT